MARRTQSGQRGGPPAGGYRVEERRASERYSRKSGNNTPIYIALGAAVLIGLVAIMFLAGSSPDEEAKEGAKHAFREFMQACIENIPELGRALVDPRVVLRDENLAELKRWRELTPARKAELTDQAFRWIQMKVETDLRFDSMEQVDAVLRACDSKYKANERRTDLFWNYRGKNWNAALSNASGQWKILRLDRASGGTR